MSHPPEHDLARQRAGAAALATLRAELSAPPRLRARVHAIHAESRGRGWRLPALGAVAAAACAALIAVLVMGGGDPTVGDAAQLAGRAPSEPAPAVDAASPRLLAGSFSGLAYPNWEPEFGWRSDGARSDELDGRAARTVFYAKDGARLAYTIVAGEALDGPESGRAKNVDGVTFTSFRANGRNAVTWLRDGHTCVLAGDLDRAQLVELAAWRGDGAVAF